MGRMPLYMRCPNGWRKVANPRAEFCFQSPDELSVITSRPITYDDGRRWLHVSCSRFARLPDYDDLKTVKRLFIGPDAKAIEVHAPDAEHVNINANVRHLFHCVDGPVTPDFTMGSGQI